MTTIADTLRRAAEIAAEHEFMGYTGCILKAGGREAAAITHYRKLMMPEDCPLIAWETGKQRSISLLLAAEAVG